MANPDKIVTIEHRQQRSITTEIVRDITHKNKLIRSTRMLILRTYINQITSSNAGVLISKRQ